ncbi:MAG: hypothetical protein U0790_17355 [Isosphaeraceae bacterium]
MDEASEHPGAAIADLARKMTAERRARFLDAACGDDPGLRADVEARLSEPGGAGGAQSVGEVVAEGQPPIQDDQADPFESLVLDAVSAEGGPAASPTEDSEAGTPILAYCREMGLEPVARLRLFQRVCHLVDGMHRRGTIHGGLFQDLVRIGPDGEPSISLGASSTGDSEGSAPAVLRSASPEQILGEPLTTAADVYGLGLVLYELMTGRYPYQTSSPEPGRYELVEAISQQAPERPSRAIGPQESALADDAASRAKLIRLLDGDLDLIVLKALQKEPEHRYRSAAVFAEDIDRFLQGRPVLAHQPGRLYGLGKLIRRHPVATVSGIGLLAALVAGLVGTSLGLVRMSRAMERSESSYEAARSAIDDLFARFEQESAFSAPDLAPARTALLESFLHYYERTAEQPGGVAPSPLVAAEARQRIGRIYELMGLPDVAAWQYGAALDAFRQLADGSSLFFGERVSLLAKLGELLRIEGDRRAEARANLEEARTLLKSGPSSRASTPENRRKLARVLGSLAELERAEGHQPQAVDDWREAVRINQERVSAKSADTEDQVALAQSLIGLGRALSTDPQTIGMGLDEMIKGVDLRQAIVHAEPSRVDQAVELGKDYRELSALLQGAGQLPPAAENARRAVDVYEQLDRRFPDTVAYQSGLYVAEDALSRLLALMNEPGTALEHALKARAVLERLVARYPRNRLFAFDLSRSHNLIGRLQQRRKAYTAALQSFQSAVDLLESAGDLDGENSYQLAANLALCISLFGAGADTPPPDDEAALNPADKLRRQVYGKRAVAALAHAVNEGVTNLDLYQTDDDLDSLRDRPDFQKILKDLSSRTDDPTPHAR